MALIIFLHIFLKYVAKTKSSLSPVLKRIFFYNKNQDFIAKNLRDLIFIRGIFILIEMCSVRNMVFKIIVILQIIFFVFEIMFVGGKIML